MKKTLVIMVTVLIYMTNNRVRALEDAYGIPNTLIPKLSLQGVTLTEAVRITLDEALKIDSKIQVANVIVNEPNSSTARVTVDLRNIPVVSALHLIAESAFYSVIAENKTIVMRPYGMGDESSFSVLIDLHADVLKNLGIQKIDENAFKELLKKLKIDMTKINNIMLVDGQGELLIKGAKSEIQRIASIIDLLNRGLRLEK